jgi:hypothetical protein
MKCQTYIYQLTSGQLDNAGWLPRLQAAQHRLICHRCRAFTRNDAQLSQIVRDFQAHLSQPQPLASETSPGDQSDAS